MKHLSTTFTGVIALMLTACTTTPERVDEVEQARSAVQNLERQPMAASVAATPLSKARESLARADTALEGGEPLPEVRHEAYLAQRHAEIGLAMIAEAEALKEIKSAEAEQRQMQLQARTLEAERAESRAEQSQAEAEAAKAQAQRLQQELSDLQAKQTERGVVLTLSDVLFETNQAELKPGGMAAIERLADFLKDHPDRRLLIEGHTDARGSEEYNEELSRRRAYAVTEALVQRGIESDRLRPVGLGEAYPVASNETSGGRQQNRRVEVVVSDRQGSFPAAAERGVAQR